MDGDPGWGVDPQTDFVSANVDHCDLNIVADHYGFFALT